MAELFQEIQNSNSLSFVRFVYSTSFHRFFRGVYVNKSKTLQQLKNNIYADVKGLTTGTLSKVILKLGYNVLSMKMEAIYKILLFTNS